MKRLCEERSNLALSRPTATCVVTWVTERCVLLCRALPDERVLRSLPTGRQARRDGLYKKAFSHKQQCQPIRVGIAISLNHSFSHFHTFTLVLSFQNSTADNYFLYFAGAFIDLCDLGIAHQALYVEFLYITIAAMYLYSLVGNSLCYC